jgi:hypothetical protein
MLMMLALFGIAIFASFGFGLFRRTKPQDSMFRLGLLAGLILVSYWLPIYYWSTYPPSGDDRDGGLLLPGVAFCPVAWLLGGISIAQAWLQSESLSSRDRRAFRFCAVMLMLVVLSPLPFIVLFMARIARIL